MFFTWDGIGKLLITMVGQWRAPFKQESVKMGDFACPHTYALYALLRQAWAPTRPAYAPLHSLSVGALRNFVLSCPKCRCICHPPCRKVWYSKKQPWAKMWIYSFVRKHPFWRSLAKKNCQFKLKFGKKTKSNMQNSMVMFPFSVFDPFRVNLNNIIKKLQFELKYCTYTNSNMYHCDADIFSFWPAIPLLGKFGPKNQNCQFKLILGT